MGGGAAATKASFNLLGGSVDFDLDLSNVHVGVNANIYTVSPTLANPSSGFVKSDYCDGAATGSKWCVEVDWIESNGDCGGATTLHTVEGPGNNGCSAWGCRNSYKFNGKAAFHMRIEYGLDGSWTTIRDGQVIDKSNLSPTPGASDWATLVKFYTIKGAVIYSSIWSGWEPDSDCGPNDPGALPTSEYSVSNLRINGTVVQGSEPAKCSSPPPSPPPSPSPSPPSPPTPPPPCQDPNGGKTSDGTLCSKQKEYGNCGASWMVGYCCSTCFNCTAGCGKTPAPNPPTPPVPPSPPSPPSPSGGGVCCYNTAGSCAGCNPKGTYCDTNQQDCESSCKGHWCPSEMVGKLLHHSFVEKCANATTTAEAPRV